jgi:hypothetical protein
LPAKFRNSDTIQKSRPDVPVGAPGRLVPSRAPGGRFWENGRPGRAAQRMGVLPHRPCSSRANAIRSAGVLAPQPARPPSAERWRKPAVVRNSAMRVASRSRPVVRPRRHLILGPTRRSTSQKRSSRSALQGERKQVMTILFGDAKGSMDLAEKVAEEWHKILDRFCAPVTPASCSG